MKKLVYFFCSIFLLCTFCLHKTHAQKDSQQQVDYNIELEIQDSSKTIAAEVQMKYKNNSQDSLDYIIIHFYPNAYKNNKSEFAKQQLRLGNKDYYFSEQKLKLHYLNFYAGEKELEFSEFQKNPDILKVYLPSSLKPEESILINCDFSYVMPTVFSRLGHHDNIYHLTQWYPKPAVYDKNGWNSMPYLDQGEFYSEFGNYEVSVKLPCNMKIASSGKFQNQDDLRSMLDLKTRKITECSNNRKTIHLFQSNIHDFGLVISDRFTVKRKIIEVDQGLFNNKFIEILSYSVSADSAWSEAASYGARAIKFFSDSIGMYEYDHFSIVEGSLLAGSGMEYPSLTIIAPTSSPKILDQVIAHEAAHNWFYGILASNERTKAFIDEGLASLYEDKYMKAHYDDISEFSGLISGNEKMRVSDFLINDLSQRKKLLSPCLEAGQYSSLQYYTSIYLHAKRKWRSLENFLGPAVFSKGMKELYASLKNSHVDESDIRYYFEKNSRKDLSWFFDDFLCSNQLSDISLELSDRRGKEVVVRNDGDRNEPVSLILGKSDSAKRRTVLTPFTGERKIELDQDIQYVSIDPEYHLQEDYSYDRINLMTGKKINEGLNLRLGLGIRKPDEKPIFATPAIGFNEYNGLLTGLVLHNETIPIHNFEFRVMPMYGFEDRSLNGSVQLNYHWWFDNGPEKLLLGLEGRKYGYGENDEDYTYTSQFLKISPSADLKFTHPSPFLSSSLKYRYVYIAQKEGVGEDVVTGEWRYKNSQYDFHEISYMLDRDHPVSSRKWETSFIAGEGSWKLSSTLEGLIHLDKNGMWVDYRVFAAASNEISEIPFTTSITTGLRSNYVNYDFGYDYIFLGRTETEGLFSNEYKSTDLDLKYAISTRVSQYGIGGEIGFKLPYVPIRPFLTLGRGLGNSVYDKILYQFGIDIPLIQDYVHIYLPILQPSVIRGAYEANNISYANQILYEVKIKNLSIRKLLDQFLQQ